MDTNSFISHVKADDIYKDIAEDVETRFDTSNFELDRPLPKGKNKKVIPCNSTPCKAEQPLRGMELQGKEAQKG